MKAILKNLKSAEIGAKRDKISHNFYKEIAVIHPAHGCVARFRFYMGSSVCHCITWFGSGENYGSGYGSAGGYGYCKESAAMESAINHAGVEMSRHWGGQGDSAMREAAEALGKALTRTRNFYIHHAHS